MAPMQETGTVGVIVLGAGRSGTSAITRALLAAGFFAGGEDELLGPAPSNPVGHYESLPVLAVNEEILHRLGCRGGDLPGTDEQLSLRAEFAPRLEATLESLIAKAGDAPAALKEPRINGLLPLWQPLLDGVLHPLLTVRDPLEVAMSVASRDGISVVHSLAAWEIQTTRALAWLDGRTATVAPYAELAARPAAAAAKIVGDAAAHLDPARRRGVRPDAAAAALRPDLRRQDASELPRAEYMTGRQVAIWDYLRELPAGDAKLSVPAEMREPSAAARNAMRRESERFGLAEEHHALGTKYTEALARLTEAEERFAASHEAGMRSARGEQLRARELERIAASASWRLTAPLRRIARVLRRS